MQMKDGISTARLFCIAVCIYSMQSSAVAQSIRHRAEAEDKALMTLSSALQKMNSQAVIEYSGSCFKPSVVIAPPIRLDTSPAQGEGGIAAIQRLLARDRRFTDISESDGIYTIAQSGIPQGLLDMRIRKINFVAQQQFDPQQALFAVLSTPEVQEYMAAHHIRQATSFGGFVSGATPRQPHLNPTFKNITVRSIIGTILQTFPDNTRLAVYRECLAAEGERIVSITFK